MMFRWVDNKEPLEHNHHPRLTSAFCDRCNWIHETLLREANKDARAIIVIGILGTLTWVALVLDVLGVI
jgi:hypothetical protein